MKRNLIFILSIHFFTISLSGQNLFFIGEQSYPCTETFTLKSNSDEYYINDLNILFAKNQKKAILGISTKTEDLVICEKLIIYLEDGTVITLSDKEKYDYVDKIASAAYYLTVEELGKIKNSNIIRVRFTLERKDGLPSPYQGNYSASNRGSSRIDFPTIIHNFY